MLFFFSFLIVLIISHFLSVEIETRMSMNDAIVPLTKDRKAELRSIVNSHIEILELDNLIKLDSSVRSTYLLTSFSNMHKLNRNDLLYVAAYISTLDYELSTVIGPEYYLRYPNGYFRALQ